MELAGSVALIAGKVADLGRVSGLMLARRGASVALVDTNGAVARAVATEIEAAGAKALAMEADFTNPEEIRRTVRETLAAFGRIDILFNLTGWVARDDLLNLSIEDWDREIAEKLRATFLYMQEVGRHMIERGGGGKIVTLGSASGFLPRHSPSHAAVTAGVAALTRTAALVLGPHDINVNSVAPSVSTASPGGDPYGSMKDGRLAKALGGRDPKAVATEGAHANMLGRLSTLDDIAEVFTFLCTPAARQITGQTIHASAGLVV